MIICSCANVTLYEIECAVRAGANSIEKLQEVLPVCLNCGSCRYYIEEFILKNN